jgi:hypothetical protein
MRDHRSNTLLIEIVIVILFFALSQAVVLQVFAGAQQLNRDAEILNRALMRAEDAAETLAVSGDADAALTSLGFSSDGDGYALSDSEGYRLTATVSRFSQPAGVLTTVELTGYQGDTELFTLPAVRYGEAVAP